jgi:hypothetical protein
MFMKTKTVGIVGTLAVNLMLGMLVAAVFSVAPVAQAHEVAQCSGVHTEQAPAHAVADHEPAGGHLTAVRMGWEAG